MANFTLMPEDESDSPAGASYRLPGVVRPPAREAPNWGGMSLAQRHAYIADFFEQHGATRSAALGIADALKGESGLQLAAVNPKSGATGLEQALGSRKDALLSQRDWTNPDVQLRNMLREVLGGDKIAAQHWTEIRQAPRDEAKNLWSKYFERPETGGDRFIRSGYGVPASGWNVAPNAIESEQNRSNTDVRLMTPEEYLSLLPPIEDSRASRAKKENLKNSLAAGDDIEAIPSLDVAPRGDNLVVADWDGRNRAQAAIDAGVDEIPVSIRGVPRERQNEFKLLVGNKKVSLPYTFVEVPRPAAPAPPVPPSGPALARQIVPQAFAPAPTPPLVPLPQAPLVPPASKLNFYPEIAAGINKDIVNPAGIGYRGVGVPDEATNATAGGRIAAANAGSAGQIGLGGAIGSALSALNPIGSAQAAESTPEGPAFRLMDDAGGATAATGSPFSLMRAQPPSSFIPGMDTVAPPLANYLFSPVTALAGTGVAMAGMPATQPLPTKASDALRGMSDLNVNKMFPWPNPALAELIRRGREAQAKMQIPETPGGRHISNILNSPQALLAWGINEIAQQNIGGVTPEGVEAASPYADLALMALPLGAYGRGRVANALTVPSRAVLNRVLQTPEMKAVRAENKAFTGELARGGKPASEIANLLSEAQRLGVPAAVIDYAVEGGPLDRELKRSMEHSAEAAGQVEKSLTERTAGPNVPSSTRLAAGGTRARMELATGREFGFESAYDLGKDVELKLGEAIREQGKAAVGLDVAKGERDKYAGGLRRKKVSEFGISKDPEFIRLNKKVNASQARVAAAEREIKRQKANEAGLNWGAGILKDSVRPEQIRDFVSGASAEATRHLRAAAGDALVRHYRKKPGAEPDKIAKEPELQGKIIEALGGSANRAEDFIDSAKAEALLLKRGNNFLNWLKRDTTLPERAKRMLYRAMEAVTHLGAGFFLGHHIYSAPYWGIRAGRQLAELSVGGGAVPRTKSLAKAELLTNPNVQLAAAGEPGLFAVPPRPGMVPYTTGRAQLSRLAGKPVPAMVRSAMSPESINELARASFPFLYGAVAPRPAAEEQQ